MRSLLGVTETRDIDDMHTSVVVAEAQAMMRSSVDAIRGTRLVIQDSATAPSHEMEASARPVPSVSPSRTKRPHTSSAKARDSGVTRTSRVMELKVESADLIV